MENEKNKPNTKDENSFYQAEEALIKQMMETEAQIKQAEADIKTSEKKINQIKKSNTWKKTATLRKLKRSNSKMENAAEAEITALQDELYELKEDLHKLKLKNEKRNYHEHWRIVKEKKDAGKIADVIEAKIKQKNIIDANHNDFLKATARLFMKEKQEYHELMYSKIFSGLKIEDIPEFMIRSGLTAEGVSLKAAASYRASLNMRMRQFQLQGTLPEMVLDDKQLAYRFMKRLNIRTPRISDSNYTIESLPEETNIAIKPVDGAGARGVYLVYTNDDIIDIKQSKRITNWQILKKDMERDLEAGRVSKDMWFTEELILEDKKEKLPARDIKFYCFYGKVALILEIVRYPELCYCWWTVQGDRVDPGKYSESLFAGIGVSQDEIEMASAISKEIPAPFMRIDFLKSEDGLVFGEFAPKPGNYDEFNNETDQWLGDYFLQAEGRLTNDLINGKEFSHYKAVQHTK